MFLQMFYFVKAFVYLEKIEVISFLPPYVDIS